jgi:hypothetical protein
MTRDYADTAFCMRQAHRADRKLHTRRTPAAVLR